MVEPALRRAPAVVDTPWLTMLPPVSRFLFYGDAPARRAAASLWGMELSPIACRAQYRAPRATLWLGPDEYLLLDFACTDLFASLERALGPLPHSLVDVSHRQVGFEVRGAHAARILNGSCPLDLDLEAFPVGMCTRTVLAKAEIVIWRTREEAFHLDVWRSFAGYVSGVLSEIAAEFYPVA